MNNCTVKWETTGLSPVTGKDETAHHICSRLLPHAGKCRCECGTEKN